MAPALRIPVALDLNSLQQQTSQASDHIGTVLKGVGRAFANVNKEMLGISSATAAGVATGWAQSAASTALSFAAIAGAGVLAFKGLSAIVGQARDQIADMVAVADKARDATVSPVFFQSFRAEANKAKVDVGDMEEALTHAFNATKDKAPIDLDKWTVGEERITDVEKALRVYNETLAKAAGTQLQGLVLFRDAQTQDDKIKAVLAAMVQLDSIGQNLAALDLGEKMFGAQFVDRIRQGKTSAESILETMRSIGSNGETIFSDAMVRNAKAVDDQLKLAQQTLSQQLKPTWDGLAEKLLTIKSLWADIIGLVAKGVAAANQVGVAVSSSVIDKKAAQLRNVETLLAAGPAFFDFEQQARLALADKLRRDIATLAVKDIPNLDPTGATTGGSPPASRGTGAAPEKKDTDTGNRDRFEAAADSIEKRTAALAAETAVIDQGTAARERAKVAAQLETVAKQINKEAGLGENVVTAEQRDRINEVADAYARAQVAIENARSPLATFAREAQNVGKSLNQFMATSLDNIDSNLAKVVSGSQTLSQAWHNMTQSIIQDLAKIAIRSAFTGPLASGINGLFGSTIFNVSGTGIGHNAQGTDNWRGGPTWVGEDGPEVLDLPQGSRITPNNVASRGAGGGMMVNFTSAPVFQAGIGPADMALIHAQQESYDRRLRADVPGIVRGALRLNADALRA